MTFEMRFDVPLYAIGLIDFTSRPMEALSCDFTQDKYRYAQKVHLVFHKELILELSANWSLISEKLNYQHSFGWLTFSTATIAPGFILSKVYRVRVKVAIKCQTSLVRIRVKVTIRFKVSLVRFRFRPGSGLRLQLPVCFKFRVRRVR